MPISEQGVTYHDGRAVIIKAALGIAFALVLASCAASPKVVWKRMDGRSVYSEPALMRHGQVDLAACHAFALNAGNRVNVPPPIQRSPSTNVYVNTAPGIAVQPLDFSALDDLSAIVQRNQELSRRSDVERANQNACMAERGYTIEVVS